MVFEDGVATRLLTIYCSALKLFVIWAPWIGKILSHKKSFFTNSLQYKNGNIDNFVLTVLLKINLFNKICIQKM